MCRSHRFEEDDVCIRSHGTEWKQLTEHARLHTCLLAPLWGQPRFAHARSTLLGLMVRFGLVVPMRGTAELLVPPLLIFASAPGQPDMPADGELSFLIHFRQRRDALGGSAFAPASAEDAIWSKDDLRLGFLPLGVFHQVCAYIFAH